jgi:hypothetical protein
MTQLKNYTEEEILELWKSTESISSIAIIVRMPQRQLKALAVAKGWPAKKKLSRRHQQDEDLTPEQIKERIEQVRANWSEAETENRDVGPKRVDFKAPTYSYNAQYSSFDRLR